MMQGATTLLTSSHMTLAARIVAEQQSEGPLVPRMLPQPLPPQTLLQVSVQQTVLSWTPARPLGQVEGDNSARWIVGGRTEVRDQGSTERGGGGQGLSMKG